MGKERLSQLIHVRMDAYIHPYWQQRYVVGTCLQFLSHIFPTCAQHYFQKAVGFRGGERDSDKNGKPQWEDYFRSTPDQWDSGLMTLLNKEEHFQYKMLTLIRGSTLSIPASNICPKPPKFIVNPKVPLDVYLFCTAGNCQFDFFFSDLQYLISLSLYFSLPPFPSLHLSLNLPGRAVVRMVSLLCHHLRNSWKVICKQEWTNGDTHRQSKCLAQVNPFRFLKPLQSRPATK